MHIKDSVENTIIIEKSRFITYLFPLKDEDEYKELLKTVRKKHYDATHVCSALILGNIRRSSDDGEPSGTAGAPMLNALEKRGMENTAAFVVRYFGGIKLGAGGLVRAYGGSVSKALETAVLVKEEEKTLYRLKVNYEIANRLESLLSRNCYYYEKDYGEDVLMEFVLKDEHTLDKITEVTRGISPIALESKTIQKVVE